MACVLGAGLLAGCGDDGGTGSAGEDGPYRVGVAVALTGPAATFGKEQARTIEALTERINADGGVNGRQIELIVEDTGTNPTEAARVGTKLIREDKVIAMFGGTTSSETLAFLPLAGREGVAVLAPNAEPEIGGDPDKPFYPTTFRVSKQVTADNGVALEQMQQRGHRRIAVIFQEDANSTAGADEFEQSAESGGVEVVERVSVPPTATDVSAQARRAIGSSPDAVYLVMSGADLTAASLRALDNAGFDGGLYGTAGVVQKALLDAAGRSADGLVAGALVNPDEPSATAKLAKLMEPLGGIKNHGNWTGAQGIAILLTGLESEPASGEELAEAIEQAGPIEGYAAAPVDYEEDYHDGLGPEGLLPVEVKDGKFVTLDG